MKSVPRRTRGFIIAASAGVWVLVGLLVIGSLEIATIGGIGVVLGLYYAFTIPSDGRRRFGWKRPDT